MKQVSPMSANLNTTMNTNRSMTKSANETARAPADAPPADMDAFRHELARRISQYVGDRRRAWRTCKEPACRRHRRCRAPRVQCSNAPPPRPDPDGRRAARAMAQVQRTLRDLQGR